MRGSVAVASAFSYTLSAGELLSFHTNGFLCLASICPPAEVVRLREILLRLFEEKAGFAEGAQYDLVGHDDAAEPARLPQLVHPVNYAPELRDTQFRDHALSIARQLLGPDARPAFEHAVLKPAGHGAVTPWHQDEAHRFDPDFEYEQVSIWMPLQDVDENNGCMLYMAGSQQHDVVPHRPAGDDPAVYALEAAPGTFNPAEAVACPLPAGGCVVHHGRTLHSAGANRTDHDRLAYILAFERPPRSARARREFPWRAERHPAALARRQQWRRRGGILVELARRVRNRLRSNPLGLLYDARVALRAAMRRLTG